MVEPHATDLEKQQEKARRYENLAYAVKSPEGTLILEEINNTLNQVKSSLYAVAMKNIPFPYEYSKEELQAQKQLRSQLDVLNEIIARLNYDECIQISATAKQKIENLISGVPIKPSY